MSKTKMGKVREQSSLTALYTSLESAKTSDKQTVVDENTEKTLYKVIDKHYKDGKREIFINDRLIHTDGKSMFNQVTLLR